MKTINKMEFLGAEISRKLKWNTYWPMIGNGLCSKNHPRSILTAIIFCGARSQSAMTGNPAASKPIWRRFDAREEQYSGDLPVITESQLLFPQSKFALICKRPSSVHFPLLDKP
jgi:hypothetical protein